MGRISTEVKTAKLQWKEHWTKAQKQEVWCNLGEKKTVGQRAQIQDEENWQAY